MNKTTLLDSIKFLEDESNLLSELYFLKTDEISGVPIVLRARITTEASQAILQLYLPNINQFKVKSDFNLIDYDPINPPTDEAYLWKLEAGATGFEEIEKQIEKRAADYYDPSTTSNDQISGILLRISKQGGPENLYFATKVYKSRNFKAGKNFFLQGSTFSPLDTGVMNIDGRVDAFFLSDTCFVVNARDFEILFDYKLERRESASKALDDILKCSFVSVADADRQTICDQSLDDSRAINKINKVSERSYALIGFAQFEQINHDFSVGLQISNSKFLITSKADLKNLLRILDDDFLHSQATSVKYLSHSKRQV